MILTTTPTIEGRTIRVLRARNQAMDELADRAARLGADAVVGIDIDYEVLGENNGMMMVTASGTAVKLD